MNKVTPHVGVWIETQLQIDTDVELESLPMWECGLKQENEGAGRRSRTVTPHVGVWIETGKMERRQRR